MTFFADLKRRNVFRVAATYTVLAWLIIQVVETIFPAFGYGDAAIRIIVIAFAIGFIPVVLFAWVFKLTPEGFKKERDIDRNQSITNVTGRKLDFTIIGLLVVALGYFTVDKFVLDPRRYAVAASTAVDGLARARELVGQDRFGEAFAFARELNSSLADEALRKDLQDIVSRTVTLESVPPGAEVWMRPYSSKKQDWEHLGRAPLRDVRIPRGMPRFRLELEGYQTINVARRNNFLFRLDPTGSIPEDMVRVPGDEFTVFMPALEHLSIELPDFLIDTTEVSNQQYKNFLDAGGYGDPRYWQHPVIQDGHELSFKEAMELFKDQTGRPGPSTWEVGMYPEGMAAHPVGGVSWYEAAAYAEYVGKLLPSLYHWFWAGYPGHNQFILPHSNIESDSTGPVGANDGVSWSGALDMAGNVREWVWNRSGQDRFLLGGGWSDPGYMFTDANAQPPLSRDAENGFRLMAVMDKANLDLAQASIDRGGRDYAREQPVESDVFEIYRRFYTYDATPLNEKLVASEDAEHWVREEVELDAAYGNERFSVFIYLPGNTDPPYRPIVFFPGSSSIYNREFPSADKFYFSFLITSGHAIVYPVYKGTFDRGTGLKSDIQDETNLYRDHVIQWSKDLGRTLDFLETREDFTMDRLGYFGISWGSAMAPVMLALEPRIMTAVLISGGLVLQPTQPEVDPFNFLPRVEIPTLMVNVPNDYFYPLEPSQKPFYQFLGSSQKDHILLKGGHNPPLNDVVRETLDWLDQFPAQLP
jgi:hypothetical protein